MKVIVVLPAFNAEKTLKKTFEDIPEQYRVRTLLVDDASSDRTIEVARSLGIEVVRHSRNRGYGGNQKTCYTEALKRGAEVVVLLHPDYQYAAHGITELVKPIEEGRADVVMGSRFMGNDPRDGGMPSWRFWGNILLSSIQRRLLSLRLTEFHTGLKAYKAEVLRAIPFEKNSEGYLFDQQILVQVLKQGFRIAEVPATAFYHQDASSISFSGSIIYGIGTILIALRYAIFKR